MTPTVTMGGIRCARHPAQFGHKPPFIDSQGFSRERTLE
jgi:hypothetical protein